LLKTDSKYKKKNLHIFLLIGQSNMAGRGLLAEVPAIVNENILMFRSGQWLIAKEPLHQDNPAIAGIGPGMSFAQELLEHNSKIKIGLLPCAVGWTSIKEWLPSTIHYENAVSLTLKAIKSGSLKAILWHQGESDTFKRDDAEKYGERLSTLIYNLRQDLNATEIPFIVGELAEFLERSSDFKFVKKINKTLNDLHNIVINYGCVNADELKPKKDNLHFDSYSMRLLGVRYAKKYLQLIS